MRNCLGLHNIWVDVNNYVYLTINQDSCTREAFQCLTCSPQSSLWADILLLFSSLHWSALCSLKCFHLLLHCFQHLFIHSRKWYIPSFWPFFLLEFGLRHQLKGSVWWCSLFSHVHTQISIVLVCLTNWSSLENSQRCRFDFIVFVKVRRKW